MPDMALNTVTLFGLQYYDFIKISLEEISTVSAFIQLMQNLSMKCNTNITATLTVLLPYQSLP